MLALCQKRKRAAAWKRKQEHSARHGALATLEAKKQRLCSRVRAQLLGVAKTDAAKLMAKRHAGQLYEKLELSEWEQTQYPLEDCFEEVMQACMVPSAAEMRLVAPLTPNQFYDVQTHYAAVRQDKRQVWETANKALRDEVMPADREHPIRVEAVRRSEELYGRAVAERPLARFLHRVSRPLGRALYHSLRQSLKVAPITKKLAVE